MPIAADVQSSADDPLSDCRGITPDFPDDPLYGCQWHLKNTGQLSSAGQSAGEDINVEGVWKDGISGRGVNVMVVGEGMDFLHEDLVANVNTSLNYNYSENSDVSDASSSAGTRAAGVIAAVGDNGLGVRGVAPRAGIYGYNLSGNFSEADVRDAMVRERVITAVSSNSWGPEDIPVLQKVSAAWEEGVEIGIREGFYGKGVFYVWGTGDGHEYNDQGNFDEYSSYYAVTAVCSVDSFGRKSTFSEEGVNLWVCAPGNDILTTGSNDSYVSVSGTSVSAAQVSGVAALMREANGKLSWRDIKLILAASARQNDSSDPGWETGALEYDSDTENYKYNTKYGFGVVDAAAAVKLARNWRHVGAMQTLTASENNDITLPDREGEADGVSVSRLTIPETEELSFTEFVEVELTFSHTYLPDLNIQITSPGGTVSQLVREFSGEATEDGHFSYTGRTHRFGSARHLGEDPAGEWTLKISDTAEGDTGTLHSWSIKVYGHRKEDAVTDSGSEAVPKHHAVTFVSSQIIIDQVYFVGVPVLVPTQLLPEATGGTLPYTYSISPDLPDGLIFDSNLRVITGTPTTVMSSANYTYTVTDDDGDTAELMFQIVVTDLTFGNQTIPEQVYTVGVPITTPVTLPAATGGNAPLTYSISSTLPTGLTFTPANREISGTPLATISKASYAYTVTDADGINTSLLLSITVEVDSAPNFGGQTITDKVYSADTAITPVTLPAATGGNGELTYSLDTTPAGLTFDGNFRVIGGTPTTAMSETTYTYTVTDADGDTAQLMFNITVSEAGMPAFGNATITNKGYVTGRAVRETLPVATGGDAPLTYDLTPALPAGLTFTPANRQISGTPAAVTSSRTYRYTVTDNDGDTDELMFNITVVEADSAPNFGGQTITDKVYSAGTAIEPVMLPAATGGNGELTYSLDATPAGLSFDSNTRQISGTPASVTSSRTYTYTVTDADGDTAQLMFNVTVSEAGMPSFGSVTITNKEYVTGRAVRETLPAATGGDTPLTYGLTPALPVRLSFDSNTRQISGTPASVTSSKTYRYTVTDNDGDTAEINFTISVTNPLPRSIPTPPPNLNTESGGGGGCAMSDQKDVVSGLLGVMACLMLIPVSVVIRRNRISRIKT